MNKIKQFIIGEFKDFKPFEWFIFVVLNIATILVYVLWTIFGRHAAVNYLALFGTTFGIMGVVFTAKGKISCFILATISSILNVINFFAINLVSSIVMTLAWNIPLSIFGFFSWFKKRDADWNVKPRKMSLLGLLCGALIFICIYLGYTFGVQAGQESASKIKGWVGTFKIWLDSAGMWIVISAVLLTFLRYTEMWPLYMLQAIVYTILWAVLYSTGNDSENMAISYLCQNVVYMVNNIYGIYNWIKLGKKEIMPYNVLTKAELANMNFGSKTIYHLNRIFSRNPQSKFLTLTHWKGVK